MSYFLDELVSWNGNIQVWKGNMAYLENGEWKRMFGEQRELRVEIVADIDGICELIKRQDRDDFLDR